ncbi:hypothetical protein SteCoe_16167 [Stentor coeruleus]|uniref:Uncharacterized protein n=1 Tax=Stentor coeruleus TaxID=5963 RepID=A0A1R2C1V2_9CILI|nr:hypothetical protein SteCoe_16167 [Stentor coeruleus]
MDSKFSGQKKPSKLSISSKSQPQLSINSRNSQRPNTIVSQGSSGDFSKVQAKFSPKSHPYPVSRSSTTVANSPTLDPSLVIRSESFELIQCMKQTLYELKIEAKNCASTKSKLQAKDHVFSKNKESFTLPETLESEVKGSFISKNTDTTGMIDGLKQCLNELENKLIDSESKTRNYDKDNEKIREIVKDLENKIEKRKFYGKDVKGSSCASKCEVF